MEKTIFDDDTKLIELCHQYIDLRERLRKEALIDPQQTPVPTKIAGELKLTLEDTLELIDFAENHLSDFELAYINENSIQHNFL
jgi:hypothetical protein